MRTKLPPEALEFFKRQGAKGGKIGGTISAKSLTKAERTERAKKAAAASAKVRSKKAAERRKMEKAAKKRG